jgi:hypothetical protein
MNVRSWDVRNIGVLYPDGDPGVRDAPDGDDLSLYQGGHEALGSSDTWTGQYIYIYTPLHIKTCSPK